MNKPPERTYVLASLNKKEVNMKIKSVMCLLLAVTGANGLARNIASTDTIGTADSAAGVSAERPQPALDVTFIAHEGFLIRGGGKKVLMEAAFDPEVAAKLGPPPEIVKAITEAQEPFNNIDVILITHKHSDHVHPASVIACLQHNSRCRLVAHTQVIDLLRPVDGFAKIADQVHEIKLEPGNHEQISENGITCDVICLRHEHAPDVMNLVFVVELGGARFVHMGDGFFAESEADLKSYPFEKTPVDVLFLNQYDRYGSAPRQVTERVKPRHIVAMHISPTEFAEASAELRSVYPGIILFEKPMERRVFLQEDDFNSPATSAAPKTEEATLMGRWNVTLGSYQDTWTFREDGTAISANQPDLQGTWKKETNCILIQWDEVEDGYKTWEAFTLPLREEGTRGGNWRGLPLRATKITS
jgi:L-ascorbate metabolism protein UlaG (beta-lactamase superfamily)